MNAKDQDIMPFRIDIPHQEVEELARRLEAVRWPDQLPGVGWAYGVDATYLRRLADYWRTGYDWRAHERRLNALPQFTTAIDGQRVHFMHLRSPEPDAVPIVLTHGWPSTFADLVDLPALLANPREHGAAGAPAFHVVVPSLPGFGFSGPTSEPGWTITRIAHAWAELMRRLGYQRYLVQGGDMGSLVSSELARVAPQQVIGVHLNAWVVLSKDDWTGEDTSSWTEEDNPAHSEETDDWQERAGYAAIQSTRPQTLAYALTDSPLGLLAWNLEWFVDYDPARTLQTPVDRDAILTNASIYWFTRTSGSSARLYKDAGDTSFYGGPWNDTPTAVALFPGDGPTRRVADSIHNIVRWTEYDRGGHFASLQAPDLLIDDIRAFRRQLG